jgi:hypothetical protein
MDVPGKLKLDHIRDFAWMETGTLAMQKTIPSCAAKTTHTCILYRCIGRRYSIVTSSLRSPANSNKTFHTDLFKRLAITFGSCQSGKSSTYHPQCSLSIKLSALHLREQRLRTIPLLASDRTTDLDHLANSIRLQQLFVVKVVKQDVDAFVHVVNLGLESLWCYGLDAGNFGREQVNDGLSIGGNVRSVTTRVLRLGSWGRRAS